MGTRLELELASWKERFGQKVTEYETEINQLRAEATERIESLQKRIEALESVQEKTETTSVEHADLAD